MKLLRALALITCVASLLPMSVSARSAISDRGPLEKVSFIHYRRGYRPPQLPMDRLLSAKPDGAGKPRPPKESSCYAFIASGAKWKTTEGVVLNPNNSQEISPAVFESTVTNSLENWDSRVSFDIFGALTSNSSAVADFTTTDNLNVVVMGPWSDSNVIGVTNVWGYFQGNPKTRSLVEWDMILNDSFAWGYAEPDSSKMDLENILVHELGHSAGMADLYDTVCSDETMYGHSSEGDTAKRTLNAGDIADIQELYK